MRPFLLESTTNSQPQRVAPPQPGLGKDKGQRRGLEKTAAEVPGESAGQGLGPVLLSVDASESRNKIRKNPSARFQDSS